MSSTFRPAVRANVNLLIGLAGASGSGKTFTAMRLASGMAQGKRFAVIDTENGRASHYADRFAFDVMEMHEPFSPAAYTSAIKAADEAGYSVVVVDSFSHEYAGSGGILDMQEADFAKSGYKDSAKMLSWIRAKTEHKRMMQSLLQARPHLILCFRAEAKIEIIKEDGKTKIVPKHSLVGLDGWIPVTEKTVPFELTISLMLTPDAPGIPKPIKLQEQHRALFPLDKPITEESGKRIAEWASGSAPSSSTPAILSQQATAGTSGADLAGEYITPDQVTYLGDQCRENDIRVEKLLEKTGGARSLALLPAESYGRACDYITAVLEHRAKATT